jgi:hypothetical protein
LFFPATLAANHAPTFASLAEIHNAPEVKCGCNPGEIEMKAFGEAGKWLKLVRQCQFGHWQ